MTIHLSIERDRMSELHKSGRYRCKLIASDGRRLFMSTRNAGSVASAKRDAEDLFGAIAWRDTEQQDVRAEATIEVER
jgi:hypothetical protein